MRYWPFSRVSLGLRGMGVLSLSRYRTDRFQKTVSSSRNHPRSRAPIGVGVGDRCHVSGVDLQEAVTASLLAKDIHPIDAPVVGAIEMTALERQWACHHISSRPNMVWIGANPHSLPARPGSRMAVAEEATFRGVIKMSLTRPVPNV